VNYKNVICPKELKKRWTWKPQNSQQTIQ